MVGLWPPLVGLVAPLALALGLGAGIFAWLFLPQDFPRPNSLPRERNAERDAALLLAPPALALATLLLGRVALAVLSKPSGAAGGLLALAAAGLFAVALVVSFGGARLVARRWSASLPPPLASGAIGVGSVRADSRYRDRGRHHERRRAVVRVVRRVQATRARSPRPRVAPRARVGGAPGPAAPVAQSAPPRARGCARSAPRHALGRVARVRVASDRALGRAQRAARQGLARDVPAPE